MTQSRYGVMLLLALGVFASLSVVTARAEAASTEAAPNHPALNAALHGGPGCAVSGAEVGLVCRAGEIARRAEAWVVNRDS